MSVIGYSVLVEEIFGVKDKTLRKLMSDIYLCSPTKLQFLTLRKLATSDASTVSKILHELKEHRDGGTYKSIRLFFDELVRKDILKAEVVNGRTYYSCKDTDIKKWLSE